MISFIYVLAALTAVYLVVAYVLKKSSARKATIASVALREIPDRPGQFVIEAVGQVDGDKIRLLTDSRRIAVADRRTVEQELSSLVGSGVTIYKEPFGYSTDHPRLRRSRVVDWALCTLIFVGALVAFAHERFGVHPIFDLLKLLLGNS